MRQQHDQSTDNSLKHSVKQSRLQLTPKQQNIPGFPFFESSGKDFGLALVLAYIPSGLPKKYHYILVYNVCKFILFMYYDCENTKNSTKKYNMNINMT